MDTPIESKTILPGNWGAFNDWIVACCIDSGAAQLPPLVGRQGETLSILHPSGKANIAGRYLDVVSGGPIINSGRPVEVVSVSGNRGNRVVVRDV